MPRSDSSKRCSDGAPRSSARRYFGDAEPTTLDELVPAQIAKERGYLIIGLHIDAEDWQSPGVTDRSSNRARASARAETWCCCTTAAATEARRSRHSVRSSTRLRARGDTVVPLSQLIGLTRDQAMPGLPPRNRARASG